MGDDAHLGRPEGDDESVAAAGGDALRQDLADEPCDDPDLAADDLADDGDGAPCRPRPGRFRRWVVRPLIWGLTVIIAVLCVSQWLLDTPWARSRAKQLISHYVGQYFERRVDINDIHFQLVPLSVEVWGLTVHGPERDDPDEQVPLMHVPWGMVEADLSGLRQRRFRLRQIRVERPLFHIAHFFDGEHNLVRFKGGSKRKRRFEVFIDHVEVDKGEFLLEQRRVRLSVSADAVQARLQGLGDLRVGGQLIARKAVVRLPQARPFEVAVSAKGEIQRGQLTIQEAGISGPDFKADVDGTCEWSRQDQQQRNCRFRAVGRARGEVLAALDYHQDLAGDIFYDGSIDWRPGAFGWRSQITAPSLLAWDRSLRNVEGGLVADRYGTRFVLDGASYGGGTLQGNITYEHEVEGRPTTVDLDFEAVELDHLLADQKIPVVGSASRVAGTLLYRFDLGKSQQGQGRAEMALTVDPTQEGLPLAGAFPVRIEDGVIRSDSIGLISDQQSLLAAGSYDLRRLAGSFDFEVASADLSQLAPLLPLADDEPSLWLPTAGKGTMSGTLFLEPGQASSQMRLRFEQVVTPSFAARQASGSFHLDGQGVRDLRLELADGEQALLMEGRIPFASSVDDPMDLRFNAFDWPMDEVHPWIPFELPFDGDVSGRLELVYDGQDSRGKLRADLSPASMELRAWTRQPIPFDQITTRLDWDGEGIRFERFDWQAASGLLAGRGTYTWEGGMDLDLRSPALELSASPIVDFLPRDDLAGAVTAKARLQGKLDEPILDLTLVAETLSLDDRRLGKRPSSLQILWREGNAVLKGQLLEVVTLEGGGRLQTGETDLAMTIDGQDVHGLLELMFAEPPEVGGDFKGRLTMVKRGAEPPQVELAIDGMHLDLRDPKGGEHQLENREPVTLRLTTEGIEVAEADLEEASTGSQFRVSGRIGYGVEEPLALDLISRFDASWLGFFEMGFDLTGDLAIDGKVAGSMTTPTLEGRGQVFDGRLLLGEGFPYPVEGLNGQLQFMPDQVVLQNLEGTMADGTVDLSGRAEFGDEDEALEYRIQAVAQDLTVRYPEGWVLRGETDLTLRSTPGGHIIDGRASLESMEYIDDIRVDFEKLMRGFLEQQRLEVAPTDSLLSTVQLNIDLDGSLAVRNNLADFEGTADLVLRGNLAEPILYGEVDLLAGGELIYNGLDYEIERGRILFANPYALDPELDLVATTRVRDFDVDLAIDGTFERLETRFTSEPPLPALEVFRLLATGDTLETSSFEPRLTERSVEDPSTSAATFLYGQAASVIGDRVNRLFGFDKFRIDPLVGSGDNLSKARVTVGKRLSKDVFVTFSDDPTSTEDQRLQVEWQVSPGLVLVLTQNGDDTYSADARWESSF